jgi:hypothetical protein
MAYLFGPGRGNEHSDMRVIAADAALGVLDGQRLDARRDRAEVLALGQRLDFARKAFGTEVPGGHVWHMSLALPAGEHLADEQWAEVAREAMDVLGFSGADGKAPCRWVAVAHGESRTENEHIHIAVTLVRGDGTKASIWNDRRKMSKFAAEVERRFGLFVVEGRAGAGRPGLSRAELERASSTSTEPERTRLARMVRAHAQASVDEAEFARRLHGDEQLLARPRFAAGGRTAVVGYSVALAPAGPEKPLWFGGGRLGADMTLPRLRTHWPDGQQPEAVTAWKWMGTPGREVRKLAEEAWPAAREEIERTTQRLKGLDPGDAAAWAGAAWEAAGVFATLSVRFEPDGGPMGRLSDELAALSRRRYDQAPARRATQISGLRGVAMVCRQASRNGGDAAMATLVIAMVVIVKAIEATRIAKERTRALREETAAVERILAAVQQRQGSLSPRAAAARLTSPAADRLGIVPGSGSGSQQRPPRPPAPQRPGPDRGR